MGWAGLSGVVPGQGLHLVRPLAQTYGEQRALRTMRGSGRAIVGITGMAGGKPSRTECPEIRLARECMGNDGCSVRRGGPDAPMSV